MERPRKPEEPGAKSRSQKGGTACQGGDCRDSVRPVLHAAAESLGLFLSAVTRMICGTPYGRHPSLPVPAGETPATSARWCDRSSAARAGSSPARGTMLEKRTAERRMEGDTCAFRLGNKPNAHLFQFVEQAPQYTRRKTAERRRHAAPLRDPCMRGETWHCQDPWRVYILPGGYRRTA